MNTLQERAMLVDLSVGVWSGGKQHKQTTQEVVMRKHAESDAGHWYTRLIPKHRIKPLSKVEGKARAVHEKMTLPWNNSGERILPAEMFMEYTSKMRELEAEFRKEVETFVRVYPEIVAAARDRLGDLYEPDWFPPAERIYRKFTWEVTVMPLPGADDFRVKLGDDEKDAVRKDIEQQLQGRLENATKSLWTRLHGMVERMADRLKDPDAIFRDSLVSNLREFCETLPKLNVANDPELEKQRQAVLKKLTATDSGTLRQNKAARASTARGAEALLKKMGDYLPKDE